MFPNRHQVSFFLPVAILLHYKHFKQIKLTKNKFVPNILKSSYSSLHQCTCDVSKLSRTIKCLGVVSVSNDIRFMQNRKRKIEETIKLETLGISRFELIPLFKSASRIMFH